jgi:hypothetical protein
MWTHSRPYKRSTLTKNSIRYHGRIGLCRALNIGRVVGFIGSGVTVAYGRPTWHQLVDAAYEYICDYYVGREEGPNGPEIIGFSVWVSSADKKPAEQEAYGLEELWGTLETFKLGGAQGTSDQAPGERLKIILELCENLAHSMDAFARRLGKRTYHAMGLRHHICQLLWQTAEEERRAGQDVSHDPVRQIYDELQIRRLLTVNYDVEIERFLRERAGFGGPPSQGVDLEKLTDVHMDRMFVSQDDVTKDHLTKGDQNTGNNPKNRKGPPTYKPFNPRVEDAARNHPIFQDQTLYLTSRDRLGRSVRSVSLAEMSIGDLITFAAFPGGHAAQVFHLHGRLDDPGNLVLTEGDYQRVYLRSGPSRQSFEEALDTLFLGNDVLFIGLGMNEADLLRPLRQFVVTDRLADVEARRIFALLPFDGEAKAVAKALDLKVRYGVETLFFGERWNWYRRDLVGVISDHLTKFTKKSSRAGQSRNNAAAEFKKVFEKNIGTYLALEKPDLDKPDDAARNEFADELIGGFSDDIRDEIRALYESTIEGRAAFQDAASIENFARLLKTAITELQTQALCEEITAIEADKAKWWKAWLIEPKHRRTAYAYTLPANGGKRTTVCVRHRPDYKSASSSHPPSSLLNAAIELMPALNTTGQRRILRLSGERGRGKGFFFHELHQGGYNKLFPKNLRGTYDGAFFAHTSFSPEFSSIIPTLVRFIGRHTASAADRSRLDRLIHEYKPPEADETPQYSRINAELEHLVKWREMSARISDRLPDHFEMFETFPQFLFKQGTRGDELLWRESDRLNALSQLRIIMQRFQSTQNKRLFICLSGLERLCDRQGNAYSASHRAFFRLLTAPEFANLPIDILLIAGDPEHPIRWLSEPGPGDTLQKWCLLPPLPLNERHWLMYQSEKALPTRRYIDEDEHLRQAPVLATLMENSVAVDSWISLCSQICFDPSGEPKENIGLHRTAWIAKLEHAATRGRIMEVLAEVLHTYRRHDGGPKRQSPRSRSTTPSQSEIRELILHHLSFFSLPIQASVLLTCPEIRSAFSEEQSGDTGNQPHRFDEANALALLFKHLQCLTQRGLVILIHSARRQKEEKPKKRRQAEFPLDESDDPFKEHPDLMHQYRFALHGQLRQYLANQMGFTLPDRGERNYYGVSLYTVQPRDLPTPSEIHFRRIYRIVEALLYAARTTLQLFYTDADAPEDGKAGDITRDIHAMSQGARAAYSIMRESFSIGALSRLKRFAGNPDDPGEPYEIYRGLLGAMIGAATGMKVHDDALQNALNTAMFGFNHPFFRAEVLWLYNERALAAYVEGRLYDAVPIFNQALRIARQVNEGEEKDDAFRATERRIILNLAITNIERGHIKGAAQSLQELSWRKMRADGYLPSFTKQIAEGYLGLCDHLSGHLARAEERYKDIIHYAEQFESMRMLSIFHRHLADLLRLLNRTDEAQKHLRLALSAAARDEQKDMHQFALVAQARLYRDIGDRRMLREACRQLDDAERYAKEMGLIKLQIEAIKTRSQIILSQGETEQAGRLAARAVGLANRNGLELQKISGLIIYGRILLERGQTELAHSVLRDCSREADRIGYQLAAIFVDRLIRISGQSHDADELGALRTAGEK